MNTVEKKANATMSMITIQEFRSLLDAPEEFGLLWFHPPLSADVKNSEQTRKLLDMTRESILRAIPREMPPTGWMGACLTLQIRFRQMLHEMRHYVHLDCDEIENAVTVLGEVSQQIIETLLDAKPGHTTPSQFSELYSEWRKKNIGISEQATLLYHHGEAWNVYPIRYPFGQLGLHIETKDAVYQVYDPQPTCPSEGFMFNLLHDLMWEFWRRMLAEPSVST